MVFGNWGVGFVVVNSSHMLPLANDSNAVCVPEREGICSAGRVKEDPFRPWETNSKRFCF
jgi:hypothetical protein